MLLALLLSFSLWAAVATKRPAFTNLFGYHPAGTPSKAQLEFERHAEELGIPRAYCHSWDQLAGQLAEWEIEPRR